jgi:hypothetical protein
MGILENHDPRGLSMFNALISRFQAGPTRGLGLGPALFFRVSPPEFAASFPMPPAIIQIIHIKYFREPPFVARSGVAVRKGRVFIPPGGFEFRFSEALRFAENVPSRSASTS